MLSGTKDRTGEEWTYLAWANRSWMPCFSASHSHGALMVCVCFRQHACPLVHMIERDWRKTFKAMKCAGFHPCLQQDSQIHCGACLFPEHSSLSWRLLVPSVGHHGAQTAIWYFWMTIVRHVKCHMVACLVHSYPLTEVPMLMIHAVSMY